VGEVGKFKGVWLPGKLERKCEKIKSGFVSSKFSVPFFPACLCFRFFSFSAFQLYLLGNIWLQENSEEHLLIKETKT
jgi:hypothetical protein